MDKLPTGCSLIIEGDNDVPINDPHFFGGPLDVITVERLPVPARPSMIFQWNSYSMACGGFRPGNPGTRIAYGWPPDGVGVEWRQNKGTDGAWRR